MIIGVICNGVKFSSGIGEYSNLILERKTFAPSSVDSQQPTAIGRPRQLIRSFIMKLHERVELRACKIEYENSTDNRAAKVGNSDRHPPAIWRPGHGFLTDSFRRDVQDSFVRAIGIGFNQVPLSDVRIVDANKNDIFTIRGKSGIAVNISGDHLWFAAQHRCAMQDIKPGEARCRFAKINVITVRRKSGRSKFLSSALDDLRVTGGSDVA